MRPLREGEKRRATLTAFVACAAGAAAIVAYKGTSTGPSPQPPAEYVVRSYDSDPVRSIGKIMASETFDRPASAQFAAASMETTLRASSFDIATHFPDVPADIRDGDVTCHVLDSTRHNRHFDLFCIASPRSQGTNA